MNAKCLSCAKGVNCINGRWCTVKKMYVQYFDKPICNDIIPKT